MQNEEFFEGVGDICDSPFGLKALEKIGKDKLQKAADDLIKADISNEEKQKRHILEKARFEGMTAMLNSILVEIKAVNKKRG